MRNKGITLIALVITIIILLILVLVTIDIATNGGMISKAQEAAFRQEMAEIKEKLNVEKSNLKASNKNISSILEKVPFTDSNNWKDTLKVEIVYWGGYNTGISKLTKEYVKKSFENLIVQTSDGNIENLYYINSEIANGKEKKYLYNEKTDIVFKIDPTNIGRYTVHSVEELDSVLGIYKEIEYEKIKDESKFIQVGDISYYEPDLTNFAVEGTNIIYYDTTDTTNTITISAQEYLSTERETRRTKTLNDKTYEFHNYNETTKVWANITVENNNLLTYWVWIPRYAYKISETETSIIYVTTDDKQQDGSDLPEGYIVHPAFSDRKKGIWISKYEPVATASQHISGFSYYIPDLTGFEKENTYAEVYDSKTETFVETKISDIEDIQKFAKDNIWFDYYNDIWANIKVVNPDSGLETWWVWVPRYAYCLEGSSTITNIIFVDTEGRPLDGSNLPDNYVEHPAFKENNKKGIWVSKYEPIAIQTDIGMTNNVNPPFLKGYDTENTYIECYNESTQKFTEQKLKDILSNNSIIDKNTKIVTTVDIDYNKINGTWYDYSKRIWANIKVVNPDSGLETWWVWIPRYAYNLYDKNMTDIIFLNANGQTLDGKTLPANYVSHPAFEVEGAHEGIWVSKYEPVNTK